MPLLIFVPVVLPIFKGQSFGVFGTNVLQFGHMGIKITL
jgi:hypothetical protein